jgi:hypothetical protein
LWDALRGLGLDQLNRASHTFLDASAAVYAHTLDVYLGQLGFPLDDLWVCDTDWALRAGRFDTYFPERTRMPTLIGSLRELGIDLERQVGLFVEPSTTASVECLPLDVPAEVRVRVPRLGGWPDYANTLRGLGSALAVVQTDPRLSFVQRWLGDESVTIGSGLLLERLVRNKLWLAARLEFETSNDFLIVSRLAWLYRIRRAAALFGFEQRVWQTEPGPGLVGDYTDGLTAALRVRHFGQSYLEEVLDTPWTTLRSAVWLRAELFAAHLHAYLRSEFDDEWWRLPRTGRFLIDELWRPGRRYTAEQLLGFMGYEGFDPAILWNELVDVLGMV